MLQCSCATEGLWPQIHVGKGSRPRAPRQSCIFTLERTETQLSGFRSINFGLGSNSKAKKWRTDLERLTSLVHGPPLLPTCERNPDTMATLHDLSIIPASPWKWYPAENPDVDWTYSGSDPGPFLSEMQQRLSHKVWEQAALHYTTVSEGANVRASMLYKIATTQFYDGSKVCEPTLPVSRVGHMMTQCFIAIKTVRAPPHSSSWTKPSEQSKKQERKPTLAPSSGFVASRQAIGTLSCQSPMTPLVEDFGSLDIMGGYVFTDGSGGAETKDPRLRRCGFGVAWIFSEGGLLSALGGRDGILHGRNQSVARADLLAAVEALRLCSTATRQVIVWTD